MAKGSSSNSETKSLLIDKQTSYYFGEKSHSRRRITDKRTVYYYIIYLDVKVVGSSANSEAKSLLKGTDTRW